MFRLVLAGLIITAMPLTGLCGIYKYRDTDGRLNFVDDESKVPAQYRDQVTALPEARDSHIVYETPTTNGPEAGQETPDRLTPDRQIRDKGSTDYQTPVKIQGNRVLVPVEVAMGNRVAKLTLLLDTGATITVLHRQALGELQLPHGKSYKARVAGGNIVKSQKIKFRHLSVGPFQVDKAYVMVINLKGQELPFDGMLGMDFLKDHPYRIDFQEKLITWEPID
ncbi:MAG: retropepsin-like aspartic protease [Desulfuromonadales bacterium]